jgi:dynein heavy chain 1, cytosolic
MEAVAPPPTASPSTNGVGPASPFVSIDPGQVLDYIAVVLEAALGATREELESPSSLLSKSRLAETTLRCQRFANDSQVAALYIQKDLILSPQENGETEHSSSTIPVGPLATFVKYRLLTLYG